MYCVDFKYFDTVRGSYRYQLDDMVVGESKVLKQHGYSADRVRGYLREMYGKGVFSIKSVDFELIAICLKEPTKTKKVVVVDERINLLKDFIDTCRCEVVSNDIVDVTEMRLILESKLIKTKGVDALQSKTLSFLLKSMGYVKSYKRLKFYGKEHRIWYNQRVLSENDAVAICKDYHCNYF